MTTRGWFILVLRLGLLVIGAAAVIYLFLAREPSSSDATGPNLLSETTGRAPESGTVVMDGAVNILGPDGSRLFSETGAELNLETGDLTLQGESTLSNTRE